MPASPFIVQVGSASIGTVALTRWDDGMAVAGGIFRPTSNYKPQEHATELDGINLTQPTKLRLAWADGRPLDCELVTLVDWSRDVGEDGREIAAYGVLNSSFADGS
jgi:hypothetical protein